MKQLATHFFVLLRRCGGIPKKKNALGYCWPTNLRSLWFGAAGSGLQGQSVQLFYEALC